jgi:demethylmenaquinone methyltransferase/2-methoxy-6-polyprenyl-1,4-benzoquinol methylase
MFAGIAPRYDLGNRVLSLGLDLAWRRRAAAAAGSPGQRALDVCAGTGDLALELARRGARVTAADFCREMVARGATRARRARLPVEFVVADALALPFASESFDAATIAFGLRNLVDPGRGLREMARILRPGGRLVVLEFAQPRGWFLRRAYSVYAKRILPRLGGWITGSRAAYEYLPRTVFAFSEAEGVAGALEAAGLEEVTLERWSGGIVACSQGRRPATG